jgi:phage terminase large subunit-like protein
VSRRLALSLLPITVALPVAVAVAVAATPTDASTTARTTNTSPPTTPGATTPAAAPKLTTWHAKGPEARISAIGPDTISKATPTTSYVVTFTPRTRLHRVVFFYDESPGKAAVKRYPVLARGKTITFTVNYTWLDHERPDLCKDGRFTTLINDRAMVNVWGRTAKHWKRHVLIGSPEGGSLPIDVKYADDWCPPATTP